MQRPSQRRREALDIAQRYSEDMALGLALLVRGMTLIHFGEGSRRAEGFDFLGSARDLAMRERFSIGEVAIIDVETASESARAGDVDAAIKSAGQVLDDLDLSGGMLYRGAATTVLVSSLLQRNAEGDLTRAQSAIHRLADARIDQGCVMHELPLLRLRALLARAEGDDGSYRQLVDRYRSRATSLGFERHIQIANSLV